jgi:hypothetical protein
VRRIGPTGQWIYIGSAPDSALAAFCEGSRWTRWRLTAADHNLSVAAPNPSLCDGTRYAMHAMKRRRYGRAASKICG